MRFQDQESRLTSGYRIVPGVAYGFFTDSSVCIGCKACEVACKQWNSLPADDIAFHGTSYDNTRQLSHSTWRHVAFVEQGGRLHSPLPVREGQGEGVSGAGNGVAGDKPLPYATEHSVSPRWLFLSDICKHCERAGCLEACPTGAIVRTEFGTVLIQQDVCNGCKYCVPSCPYGVITTDDEGDGMAHKCTLCYDRLKGGMEPACAKACPTDSIQFGPVEELRARASARLEALHANGFPEARLYGMPGNSLGATNGIRGLRSFFLLMDDPNLYNLPAEPVLPARNVVPGLVMSLAGGAVLLAGLARAFWRGR